MRIRPVVHALSDGGRVLRYWFAWKDITGDGEDIGDCFDLFMGQDLPFQVELAIAYLADSDPVVWKGVDEVGPEGTHRPGSRQK